MNENTTQEPTPEYAKKFNDGYTLTQFMPEIASKIADALKDAKNGEGFIDGRNQYLHELALDRTPAWLKRDFTDLGKDLSEQDKDGPTPEKN